MDDPIYMSMTAEPRFMTTRELADLLRVKERKIYDMAAAGDLPCTRVTGKLLFPRDQIEAWMARDSVTLAESRPAAVVAGSHDPLLDWAIRQSGCGLATFLDGSLDGLQRLQRQEALMCGTHLAEEGGIWNIGHLDRTFRHLPIVAIAWAQRRQGLIVQPGTDIAGFADLGGRRLALRQPSAGSRVLFDRLATQHGLASQSYDIVDEPRTETEAAAAVASGSADAALGLEVAARQHRLGFVPLVLEQFDLAMWRWAYFEPPLQALWRFCRDRRFADKAAELGGYDLACHGQVRWNGA